MKRSELKAWIDANPQKLFWVRFWKRTTQKGESPIREMACMSGVVAEGLVGDPRPAKHMKAHGLIGVWDVEKSGYRSFALREVICVSMDNKTTWIRIADDK